MSEEIRIKFLEKSLDINHGLRNAFDYKANFLLAISGIIFTLSTANHLKPLQIMSALSAMLCILSIILPQRRIKTDGLLCWWGLKGKSFDDYKNQVNEIDSETKLADEYQKEIYQLYKNSIKYKSLYLKLASLVLLLAFIYYLLN